MANLLSIKKEAASAPAQMPVSVSIEDEGGLASPHVSMSEEEAIEVAASHYKLNGRATRFATEKDDTFRIETADGQRYILKVANPNEQVDELSFQVDLIEHIARVDSTLPIPSNLLSVQGQPLHSIADRAGQKRYVRMLTYLEGTPLDSVLSSAAQRYKIGQILARLRLATASFTHAGESRVLAWDIQHLPSLQSLLSHVSDASQREKLAAGMGRFIGLQARIGRLRQQVLHNDFSRSNIVVDGADPDFVTGIIDFGDAVKTAIAIDVSTALLNQLPVVNASAAAADLFQSGRDLLNGYLSVVELTEEELSLLAHLTMGRLVARALLTLWRAKLMPENRTYILRNTAQGWAQLDWFLNRSVDEVSSTFL